MLATFLCCACGLSIIRDLLQYNGAGIPVLHKTVEYAFDPDVGARRSRLYREVNGNHGEKYIERLGLGIDGRDEERLEQQKQRDAKLYELLKS